MAINSSALAESCDLIAKRCITIANTRHGSAWLFDKLMRYFESEPAVVDVTIPVYINLIGAGEATINRDGHVTMRRTSECACLNR